MMPIEASISMVRAMGSQRPIWFEKPIRIDRLLAQWKTLAAAREAEAKRGYHSAVAQGEDGSPFWSNCDWTALI
jgi:hypothetical protein